jgi:hypothetical protein
MRHTAPPILELTDGQLEALKWIAALAMTGDHINKYLFHESSALLFSVGRLALPLFVFVLAYNLGRPEAFKNGASIRTISRLFIFGACASVPFIGLGEVAFGWYPLNVMFLLLILACCIHFLEKKTLAGYALTIFVFVMGGALVEFWWFGLMFGLAVWWYRKSPCWRALLCSLCGLLGLYFVNGNMWAAASLVVILIVSYSPLSLPRLRWFFYGYYPVHLSLLWMIKVGRFV